MWSTLSPVLVRAFAKGTLKVRVAAVDAAAAAVSCLEDPASELGIAALLTPFLDAVARQEQRG